MAPLRMTSQNVVVRQNRSQAMADAFVESVGDVVRRSALRTIAASLKTITAPPFPKEIPWTVLWGDSDYVTSPPTQLPGISSTH